MPEVPIAVWLTFAAALIIVNRIPFMPGKDLLFVGAGIELAMHLDVATAQVASMLLVASVLTKVLNLSVFVSTRTIWMEPEPRIAT
jgi:hypothetical protein